MELTLAYRILDNIMDEAKNAKNYWKFLRFILYAIYEKNILVHSVHCYGGCTIL
jgi:protein-tyrosine phosphatase